MYASKKHTSTSIEILNLLRSCVQINPVNANTRSYSMLVEEIYSKL